MTLRNDARAVDGPSYLQARGDIELAKDVAQMGLDCLRAEEQRGSDFGVGLAFGHESVDIEQELRPVAGSSAVVDPAPKPAQLALGQFAMTDCTARVQIVGRACQFGDGRLPVALLRPGNGRPASAIERLPEARSSWPPR